ncbi:MAG: Uma2 family endonuclease [Deltaproteobacteria bacterium]|nr:Uma2 family endonuclease [Deltaproteobacteria bacterium]
MNRHRRPRWTVEEFLDWDNSQGQAHEYVGGMIRTPTIDTKAHATIEVNVRNFLAEKLTPPARVLEDHERVVTGASASFPDVAVTSDSKEEARPQPVVVFEVLARRTENLDRTHKWIALQTLASLQYFVLIAQDRMFIELFTRTDDNWDRAVFTNPTAELPLPKLGVSVPLSRIYAGTSTLR